MGTPHLKKKATSFFLGEDGKISKRRVVTAGIMLTGIAGLPYVFGLGYNSLTSHTNNFSGEEDGSVDHTSHGSHGSHGSHSSHSSHSNSGGCPFVGVWDGSGFVMENNLLPSSEEPENAGLNVTDKYLLKTKPVPVEGKLKAFIGEFEQEHTDLSDVQMLAVKHDKNINLAVDREGKITTYRSLVYPEEAIVNDEMDYKKELSTPNEEEFFEGDVFDKLKLKFSNVNNNARLIFNASLRSSYKDVVPEELKSFPDISAFADRPPRLRLAMFPHLQKHLFYLSQEQTHPPRFLEMALFQRIFLS